MTEPDFYLKSVQTPIGMVTVKFPPFTLIADMDMICKSVEDGMAIGVMLEKCEQLERKVLELEDELRTVEGRLND